MLSTITTPRQQLQCLTVELDFNAVNPLEAARSLQQITAVPDKRMLINCDHLDCVRTHGVCFFISQLLRMRSYGITLVLRRVPAELGRALHILRLDTVFVLLPGGDN
ncbi:MAG TPA: hypothetical protein VF598_05690 [Hymenobacter sp.]|jgi:anti-anti-sigma regulatory factor